MEIEGVDPRDQTWAISNPKHRVNFHGSVGASDEYELNGGPVADVMAWAEIQSRGRTSLSTPARQSTDWGLLRLPDAILMRTDGGNYASRLAEARR